MRARAGGPFAVIVLALAPTLGHAQAPPAPPAPPQNVAPPVPGFVPPYEVMRTVRAAGFDPLAPPLREGTIYVLRATDFRGVLMRVVVDARTGAIRDANRILPGPGSYGPGPGRLGMVPPPYQSPPQAVPPPYGRPPHPDVPPPPFAPSATAVSPPPVTPAVTRAAAPPLPRPRPEPASAQPAADAKPVEPKPAVASNPKPATESHPDANANVTAAAPVAPAAPSAPAKPKPPSTLNIAN